MNNTTPSYTNTMKVGNQNSFQVTHNGQTKTVSGNGMTSANAARQAFGANAPNATIRQTQVQHGH